MSLAAPAVSFAETVRNRRLPRRVGYSRDLGIVPVDSEVAAICEKAAQAFAQMGVEVVEARPNFSEAMACFQTLRAASAREHTDRCLFDPDQCAAEYIAIDSAIAALVAE